MADDREQAARLAVLAAGPAAARRPELLALALRAKAGWGYDATFMVRFEAVMRDTLADPELTFIVAESDGVLVGFASVAPSRDPAWLEDLWVDPGQQGTGLGTALLEAAAAIASTHGATALECESDPNAEPFYVSRGARRVAVHPSSLDERRMLPTMRLDLTGP